MKRFLIGMVLGGCSVGDVGPASTCERGSTITHRPEHITSGRGALGISWRRDDERFEEVHGAIVLVDGTITPEIFVRDRSEATAGNTTVLWYPTGTDRPEVDVTLDRGGLVDVVRIADAPAIPLGAIFDGDRYQVFWRSGDVMHHRSLSEAGELGPVHALAIPPAYRADLATDRAGTTLVRCGADAFIVDSNTGSVEPVFRGDGIDDSFAQTFWFAGQFHVFDRGRRWSFDATSSAGPRTVAGLHYFMPGVSRLFAVTTGKRVVEVDAAFNQLRDLGVYTRSGILGDDLVRFVATPRDEATGQPASIELVRDSWRRVVAVDFGPADACLP